MPEVAVTCRVNGVATTLRGHPLARLLDVLRVDLRLTGTKEGCGEGECGACSVLMNGRVVNSCLVPLLHAGGADIVTIEGLGSDESLHTLQEAFITCGGAQCGICTPGMIVAAVDALSRNGAPDDDQVRRALGGNLCRCTGYVRIVEAVRAACRGASERPGEP